MTQNSAILPEDPDTADRLELPAALGPFRLDAVLGRGGMGEVFLAWDRRLERQVAIKKIRKEKAAESDVHRQRLLREAQAGARLGHPAIVQVFDIVELNGFEWIVMELVDGPTVEQLTQKGPLELGLALSIAKQVAEGLAAAHGKGFLHRDLKAENVMVDRDGRAKILDFGLAKRLEIMADGHVASGASLTHPGEVMGTCRSMSPEQARGLELDGRSDLFSLGVLLYEMATGHSPFRAETPVATLGLVCTHLQPPAASLNPEVPLVLSDYIDRLLEKDANRRPRNANKAARDLKRLMEELELHATPATTMASLTPVPTARRQATFRPFASTTKRQLAPWTAARAAWAVGLVWLVVLAVVVGVYWQTESAEPGVRTVVAVLDFSNLAPDPATDWMGPALRQLLAAELGLSPALRVVADEQVAHVRLDLDLKRADSLTAATLERVQLSLGADLVILGSYHFARDPARWILLVNVQDTRTGAVRSVARELDDRQLLVASRELGEALRALLRAETKRPSLPPEPATLPSPQPSTQTSDRPSTQPSPPQASHQPLAPPPSPPPPAPTGLLPQRETTWRLVAEAAEARRRQDPTTARRLLEQAAAAEPTSPQIWLALASLAHDLGLPQLTREASERALVGLESQATPTSESWRVLAAQQASWAGEGERAVAAWRSLAQDFPDNPDHRLHLAQNLAAIARWDEAEQVLQDLLAEPAASNDLRVSAIAIELALARGQAAAALTLADELRGRADARGARWLLAQALLYASDAHGHLGDSVAQATSAAAARTAFAQLGDRSRESRAWQLQAVATTSQGAWAESRRLLEAGLAASQAWGDLVSCARLLGALADLDFRAGLAHQEPKGRDETRHFLREALEAARQAGALREEIWLLARLAELDLHEQRLDRARDQGRLALAQARAAGLALPAAWTQLVLARIAIARQDQPEATRLLDEGEASARTLGQQELQGLFLLVRADLAQQRQDHATAQSHLDHAATFLPRLPLENQNRSAKPPTDLLSATRPAWDADRPGSLSAWLTTR